VDHRLFGAAHWVGFASTCSLFGGTLERGPDWWVVSGTLLGPEDSGVFAPFFS
jgi:hypothetical protein